ncbi:MAG: hypothetical protein IM638_13255 [Bacteroidetes bacterium]|nr:hypothetical protein [Bacteroidota bacterium]
MKGVMLFLLWMICTILPAQENVLRNTHQLSYDAGTLRNRYIYPATNVQYTAPELKRMPVQLSVRLRSYGAYWIFSKTAYDITPLASYRFTSAASPFGFAAGAGADIRLRLVNDERSEATSSAEPLVFASGTFASNRFYARLPLWTRFYSNGISFTLLPEAGWKCGKHLLLFLRHEQSLLRIYQSQAREWRGDWFLGLTVFWP